MKITEDRADILRALKRTYPDWMSTSSLTRKIKRSDSDNLSADLEYLEEYMLIELKSVTTFTGKSIYSMKIMADGIDALEEFDAHKEDKPIEQNNDVFNVVDINELIENKPPTTNEVFIVHGRDEGAREKVARFLEKLDLKPFILADLPSRGRTIIEKIEAHSQVGFAVVLLTPDDIGVLQGEEDKANPRPRQNVIFEMGFFVGRLGRERVCVLTKKDVDILSDYSGVVYIPLDSEEWKYKLIKELKTAGFEIDANKAL